MTPRLIWLATARNVSSTMAYRGAFFLLMLSTGLTPVISLLVWLTVGAQGVRLPYDRGQFVTYFLLLAVVSMLTASWIAQYTAADIRQGKLSPDLLQPANPILYGIGNNIGEKIVKLPLLLPVVAVAALTLKGLRVPASPVRWLEFAAAVLLAAVIRFLMDYATGLLAFWISDVEGLVRVRDLAAGLLAGQVVPLALFPSSLEPWLRVQPFRYMLSFPLELVTRDIPPGEVAVGFALAAGWLLVFYAAYRLLWTRGLRSYSAAGA